MTDIEDAARLRELAQDAARTVAAPLRAAFRGAQTVTTKRDRHDVVTLHDRAAEDAIAAVLRAGTPDCTILGEEAGARGSGRVHWHVDPIDGTANFASGIAMWCISIAAAVEGRLVAGVILDPMSGHLFAADRAGAWLDGAPLRARACPDERQAVLLTGFPNARHLNLFGRQALDVQAGLADRVLAVRNLGSGALHLAHVAAGWADATMSLRTNPWDVAAGALILTQAGGHYRGFRDGAAMEPAFLAPDCYATGPGADYAVLDAAVRTLSAARQTQMEPT